MNKTWIVVILAVLLLGGGFFILRGKSDSSYPARVDEFSEPKNPDGVVNEEVEGSNYKLFDKSEYEKAVSDGKVVMLYFTANWCPICREQEPINKEALSELIKDTEIVAFRVHILDDEETSETQALADEFAVRYQHTTVILNSDGEVSETATGPISKEELKNKLLAAK